MKLGDVLRPKSKEEIEDLEKRGFRRDSGKWIFQINISDIINEYNRNENIGKFKEDIIDLLISRVSDVKLFAGKKESETFENIIMEFRKASNNVEDVDKILDMMYEWGDDNNVWIESTKNN